MPKRQIVVTLSSIPPRFGNLPKKLASIAAQTHRPDRVELHIPKTYRRFPGERPALPALPDWIEVIEGEFDYGPATKILPAARRWRGTETDLLLCDDDRLQDRGWVARFVEGRRVRPEDILCERAWNISDRFGIVREAVDQPRAELDPKLGRSLSYRLLRLASLNFYRPPRMIYRNQGYADVFEGFLGAMLPADALPEQAFDIPDIIWTVDDVWLSGMAYLNGKRIWVNAMRRPVGFDGPVDHLHSLRDHVESGIGRDGADRYAVDYLR
ncbi:glycosyltransferase family 2 protein, partial [Thioclava sp. BHET1]